MNQLRTFLATISFDGLANRPKISHLRFDTCGRWSLDERPSNRLANFRQKMQAAPDKVENCFDL
jgi:hypothetical protein